MRTMIDSAERPPASGTPGNPTERPLVIAGYLPGGDVFRVWTDDDWAYARANADWLLPIAVASPSMDGNARAMETVADALARGFVHGDSVALDVEANMAPALAASGAHQHWVEGVHNAGFNPIVYTSEEAVPQLGGWQAPWTWWVARWDNQPPTESDISYAHLVQYASPTTNPALAVDLSVVRDDTLALHATSSPVPAPEPAPAPVHALNAPVCAAVNSPDGRGYWLVAADGGVFAFGDALAFPDPIPAEKLNRPVVAAFCTLKGDGLTLVGADGGVFTLGAAPYFGSIPALHIAPAAPEV